MREREKEREREYDACVKRETSSDIDFRGPFVLGMCMFVWRERA